MSETDKPRRDILGAAVAVLVLIIVAAHPTSRAFSLGWLGRLLGFSEKICAKAPHLAVADILIWVAGAALALRFLIERDWKRLRLLSLPGALLAAWAVVSMLFAVNKLTAVAEAVQFVEYFVVLYLLFATTAANAERLKTVIGLWLAVGVVVVVWALVHYLNEARPIVNVDGPFLNRNVLSGYLAMLVPFAFAVAVTSRRWPIVAQCAGIVVVGLVVMLAGGPVLGTLVGMGVVAFVRSPKVFPLFAAAIVVLLLVGAPELPRDNAAALRQSVQSFDEGADAGEASRLSPRYVEWQAAEKFLTPGSHAELGIPRNTHLRQLLLGVGVGNYQTNIGRFYGTLPKPNANTTEPDTGNLYLVLAVSAGIPAALIFLWLVGAHIRRAAQGFLAAGDPELRGILLGCIGALASLLVTNVFTETLVHGSGPATVLVLALAASAARIAERTPRATE